MPQQKELHSIRAILLYVQVFRVYLVEYILLLLLDFELIQHRHFFWANVN